MDGVEWEMGWGRWSMGCGEKKLIWYASNVLSCCLSQLGGP